MVSSEDEMDVPGRGLFCSPMSLASCHVLMNSHVSKDIKGKDLLQAACNKPTIFVVAIHHGGRMALVHEAGALGGIRYRN